eukprot:TRINITY_DN20049_c0_g1_i1.p1 TRINITY_DN20049_c0_g1~~TRINITY_DN20049_c0_g1_i1.p1  ORF type:complete len:508 (+),score=135.17 TRINITY_DN20049_c0_g1_i1:53-1576(+)
MAKKRIVRKRKTTAPKKRNVLENESEEEDVVEGVAVVEGEDDVEVAERLRLEAMKAGGREWKELAAMLSVGKEMKIKVARGAATCAVITNDGEWLWYGDKNGNVFRMNLPANTEWVQMSRHKGQVLSMAATDIETFQSGVHARGSRSTLNTADAKYKHLIATGGTDGIIKIFNAEDGTIIHELQGHRGAITGVSFRIGKNILISGSNDRTIKIWAAEDGVLLDTFFGHTGKITSVTAGWKDEALSTGDDCTARLFKFEKGSALAFAEGTRVMEDSTFVNDNKYLVGGSDGGLNLYDVNKRRPAARVAEAHGRGWNGDGDGLQHNMTHEEIQENVGSTQVEANHVNWVTAVGSVPYSDLAASGGFGNELKFWRIATKASSNDFIQTDAGPAHNDIRPLKTHPISGIPSSIYFPRSGTHCVVTVSRELRLGRWLTDSAASNHILVLPLEYTNEPVASDDEEAMQLESEEAGQPAAPAASGKPKKMIKRVLKPKGAIRKKIIKKKRQLRL